jgi:hypothetical protein
LPRELSWRRNRQGRTDALRPRQNPAPGSSSDDVQHFVAGAKLLLDVFGEFGPALTKGLELEARGSLATQDLPFGIPAIKRVYQSA